MAAAVKKTMNDIQKQFVNNTVTTNLGLTLGFVQAQSDIHTHRAVG